MKKTLLSLFAAILVFQNVCISQTLTAVDCSPQIGEIIESSTADLQQAVTAGPSGVNKVWDFSVHLPGVYAEKDTLVGNISAPGASLFPAANMVKLRGALHQFLKVDGSGVEDVGVYFGSPLSGFYMNYSNPRTKVRFPIVYGETYSDQSACLARHYFLTHTLNIVASIGYTVDGAGTLKSPVGTFSNTLRLHTHSDMVGTYVGSSSTVAITQDNYDWYAAGIHDPVLSVVTETIAGEQPTARIFNLLSKNNLLGIGSSATSQFYAKIFPNPASDKLTFRSESTAFNRLVVYNALGAQVLEHSDLLQTEISLDLSALPEGFYVVKAFDESGLVAQKKLTVSR